jgi:hypothetical protein
VRIPVHVVAVVAVFAATVAALAPRPTWIVNAADPMGQRLEINDARKQYARAAEAFNSLGAADSLHIEAPEPGQPFDASLRGLK